MMKRCRNFSAFVLLCLLPVLPAFTVGCATKATLAEGSELFVVNAEMAQQMAFEAVDTFLAFEKSNRDALWSLSTEVKQAADRLRTTYPAANQSLLNAIKAYKKNRTAENKTDVNTWLAVASMAKDEAQQWLAFAVSPQQ